MDASCCRQSSFLSRLPSLLLFRRLFRSAITLSVFRTHITTMTMALHSSGVENTIEMNIPLESKYWYFENNLQFAAAASLMYSAQETNVTRHRKCPTCSPYLRDEKHVSSRQSVWKTASPRSHGSVQSVCVITAGMLTGKELTEKGEGIVPERLRLTTTVRRQERPLVSISRDLHLSRGPFYWAQGGAGPFRLAISAALGTRFTSRGCLWP